MVSKDYVLKNFFNKVNEVKKQGIKEVKFTYNELNDLSTIISELLSDYYSKTYDIIDKLNNLSYDDEEIIISGGTFNEDE